MNKFFIMILCLGALVSGFGLFIYQSNLKLDSLIQENQEYVRKIAQLEIEKLSLADAIKKQNTEIEQFKSDVQDYKTKIDNLNEEITKELEKAPANEILGTENATPSEAIEWLKMKRKNLDF